MSNHQINWNELGIKLKAAREAQGYSIEEAALQTRIAPWIIDSLEKGDDSKLPGLVFAKGFVKNLAKIYSVDAQVFLEFFNPDLSVPKTLDSQQAVPLKINSDAVETGRSSASSEIAMKTIESASKPVLLPWSWIISIVASLMALGVWISLMDRHSESISLETAQTEVDLNQPVDTAVVESSAANADTSNDSTEFSSVESTEPVPEVSPEAVKTEVVVEEKQVVESVPLQQESSKPNLPMSLSLNVSVPVQIRLKADNRSQETLSLDAKLHKFEFNEKAELLIFDAAAAQVSFNGEDIGPLGGKGRVRRLSFVRELP